MKSHISFDVSIEVDHTTGEVQAAYFRVQVPANRPGWKIKLTPSVGEVMLVVLSNHVPNVDSGRLTGPLMGKFMQKAGNEHYLILPLVGSSNIIAGTYYLAVVGEGIKAGYRSIDRVTSWMADPDPSSRTPTMATRTSRCVSRLST